MRSCCRWLSAAGWLTDNNNNNESNECVTVPEGRVIYSMYYDYSDAPARAASQRECLTAHTTDHRFDTENQVSEYHSSHDMTNCAWMQLQ